MRGAFRNAGGRQAAGLLAGHRCRGSGGLQAAGHIPGTPEAGTAGTGNGCIVKFEHIQEVGI